MKTGKSYNIVPTASFALVFFGFLFFQTRLPSILKINAPSPLIQDIRLSEVRVTDPLSWLPVQLSKDGGDITCDRSHATYDLCTLHGPTLLDPTTATFYVMGTSARSIHPEKIRPYPRKAERHTMSRIREITLKSGVPAPTCQFFHNAPAMVFSAGGYTGNFFHDFNDGFIPLYLTINSVFSRGQNFVFVVSKAREWWLSKYADLLRGFTDHPIISLENERATHCFTSAAVGLVSHGFMTIDNNSTPYRSFLDFNTFLTQAYSRYIPAHPRGLSKPRLVFVSRTGKVARAIQNQEEVKQMMEDTGFEVVMFEPKASTPLGWAAKLLASSHAMIGVHGAALTHFVFLRPGAVFGQVVPGGVDWAAEVCFGAGSRAMGLKYIEYKIEVEESDLVDKYGREETVIKDPAAFRGEKWSNMEVYLKQNVRLDVGRFKEYLKQVHHKAREFMHKEG